jgi:hypothetical protein
MDRARAADGNPAWLIPSLFALGLAIAGFMVANAQTGGDALCLLSRGWLLAAKGTWVHLGASASGGGWVPGGLTALLVGLPLKIWPDPRAPVVLILIFHVIAYALLDRLVKESIGFQARVVFAIMYWLNPWQLYQASWLDNTNYAFLPGAVHAFGSWRGRNRKSFFYSALIVGVVGLTVQLHLHATTLVFASLLLWWRGYWKPHWGGVALGAAITVGSLVPFFIEASRNPELLPGSEDPMLRSLVYVWPVLKGIMYWFRYASLHTAGAMRDFDFAPRLGSADVVLRPLFVALGHGVGVASIALPVLANRFVWLRFRKVREVPGTERMSSRGWIRGYAVWLFVACFIANATSPIAVMYWHNLIALHATVLPVVLWVDALLRTPHAATVRKGMAVYLGLSVTFLLAMAIGSPDFRTTGLESQGIPDRDHELLIDLGMLELGVRRDPGWAREERYFYQTYMKQYEIPETPTPPVD